ncbi:MAG: hypothetical protein WBV82_24760, partial [Myxococcaceae bacterium]
TAVKDTLGKAIDATANTATFNGYVSAASLIITEVNAKIAGGLDLLEIQAVTGGSINGVKLEQVGTANVTAYATLPDIIVQAGDIVLVHVGAAGLPTETSSKTEVPNSTNGAYSDNAWDVGGNNTGWSDTNARVLRLTKPDGTTMTSVPFVSTNAPSTQWETEFQAIVAAGLWTLDTACAASPCTTEEMIANSVNWSGLPNSSAGSVYRSSTATTNSAAAWTKVQTGATFGTANP